MSDDINRNLSLSTPSNESHTDEEIVLTKNAFWNHDPDPSWPDQLRDLFERTPPLEDQFYRYFAKPFTRTTDIDSMPDAILELRSKYPWVTDEDATLFFHAIGGYYSSWEPYKQLVLNYIKMHDGLVYPIDWSAFEKSVLTNDFDDFNTLIALLMNRTGLDEHLIKNIALYYAKFVAIRAFKKKLDRKGTITNSEEAIICYVEDMVQSDTGLDFLKEVLIYYFSLPDWKAKELIENQFRNVQLNSFERKLMAGKKDVRVNIDSLSPLEFEEYVAGLFRKKGYEAELTKKSHDYGVDVLATKGNERWAIQAKHYSSPAGIDAVQEVIGGKNHYHCNNAAVFCSNDFTKSARELARSNNITLFNREEIKKFASTS